MTGRALSSSAAAMNQHYYTVRRRTDSRPRIRQADLNGKAQSCNCHRNKDVPTDFP